MVTFREMGFVIMYLGSHFSRAS